MTTEELVAAIFGASSALLLSVAWVVRRSTSRLEARLAELESRPEPACAVRDGAAVVVQLSPGELAMASSRAPAPAPPGESARTLSVSKAKMADLLEADARRMRGAIEGRAASPPRPRQAAPWLDLGKLPKKGDFE
jgi:hypothetical protein